MDIILTFIFFPLINKTNKTILFHQTSYPHSCCSTCLHTFLGTELHCCIGTLEHCCVGTVSHAGTVRLKHLLLAAAWHCWLGMSMHCLLLTEVQDWLGISLCTAVHCWLGTSKHSSAVSSAQSCLLTVWHSCLGRVLQVWRGRDWHSCLWLIEGTLMHLWAGSDEHV